MVAARSEGGTVEVDSGSTIMTKSLRKRTTTARSEVEDEAAACSGAGSKNSNSLCSTSSSMNRVSLAHCTYLLGRRG
jgi:hypothetical protein